MNADGPAAQPRRLAIPWTDRPVPCTPQGDFVASLAAGDGDAIAVVPEPLDTLVHAVISVSDPNADRLIALENSAVGVFAIPCEGGALVG